MPLPQTGFKAGLPPANDRIQQEEDMGDMNTPQQITGAARHPLPLMRARD